MFHPAAWTCFVEKVHAPCPITVLRRVTPFAAPIDWRDSACFGKKMEAITFFPPTVLRHAERVSRRLLISKESFAAGPPALV